MSSGRLRGSMPIRNQVGLYRCELPVKAELYFTITLERNMA